MDRYPQPRRASREYVGSWAIFLIGSLASLAACVPQFQRIFAFLQVNKPGLSVFLAFTTAVMSAGLVAVIYFEVRWFDYVLRVKPLQEFWGQRFGQRGTGSIYLQSDTVGDMLKDIDPELDKKLNGSPANRFFKARDYLNRYDTEGAKEIRAIFASAGFDPPEFVSDVNAFNSGKKSKLVIFMGLGFTPPASDFIEKHCSGWLRAVRGARETGSATQKPPRCIGDAILLKNLWSDRMNERIEGLSWGTFEYKDQEEVTGTEWRLLVPRGWDIAAYSRPNAAKDPNATAETSETLTADYGYILRRSGIDDDGVDRTTFHIGGFTQHGTKVAAYYLASSWSTIHKDFISKKAEKNGLILILSWARPRDNGMPTEIWLDQAIYFASPDPKKDGPELIESSAWRKHRRLTRSTKGNSAYK